LTRTKLSREVEQLEQEIAMLSTDFKNRDVFLKRKWNDVQNELRRNEAIVELVDSKDGCYALILKSKGDVEYAYIASRDSVFPLLNRDIESFYYDDEVTALLWNEVSNHLEGSSKIYYYPVGIFNSISLGTLYCGAGTYLCDKYELELISNPSEIESGKINVILVQGKSTVSLWGGIDYGTSMTPSMFAESKHRAISRGDSLKYLIHSYDEVVKISRQLTASNIQNKVYKLQEATEQSFWDRESMNDAILHVSSHGYFNDDSFVANKRSSMYNCGLFFAGSNQYWINDSIPADIRTDGILRAAEIATMDFTNCELVVLSACETGLGYNDTSEGVYGLQRAFRLAGANKILMSLWKVGDEPTSLLMQEFYKSLLEGNSPNHALSVAKSFVRKSYKSPKDWGGFVILN
jgi:CHAT domain-containing protein